MWWDLLRYRLQTASVALAASQGAGVGMLST